MKKLILIILIAIALPAPAQRKYSLECDSQLLEASLDTAIAQVGTREPTGRNDGPVGKYLAAVGLGQGYPYCAAGQYYCFRAACEGLNMPLSAIPIKRSATANYIYNDAAKRGVAKPYIPARHDLIVWLRPRSWSGHIERIISVGRGGWVRTVGFNTGGRDPREGEGVFIKKRNVFHALGRLRIRGLIGFTPK
ncbi:MAG: hypothetical protein ACLFQX_02000 [Candidatus Kapaibacterium sp.]